MSHRQFVWRTAIGLFIVASIVALQTPLRGEDQNDAANEQPHLLAVKLVDGDGQPVAGADVGFNPAYGFTLGKNSRGWGYMDLAQSDNFGMATLTESSLVDCYCVVARHAGRKLMAVSSVDPKQVGSPVKLTLVPECEVSGEVVCKELADRNRGMGEIVVYFHLGEKVAIVGRFDEPAFRLPLPPGEFTVTVSSRDTFRTSRLIEVPALPEFHIELLEARMSALALLAGKPAPELQDVLAWTNDKPIKLAELRGKCVLLTFLGWGRDYEYHLPELARQYDAYHDQGLVIVGLHIDLPQDRCDARSELDAALRQLSQNVFAGREVPFPVGILSGETIAFGPNTPDKAYGPTAALYGPVHAGMQVLIDRRGNVVGQVAGDDQGDAALQKALSE